MSKLVISGNPKPVLAVRRQRMIISSSKVIYTKSLSITLSKTVRAVIDDDLDLTGGYFTNSTKNRLDLCKDMSKAAECYLLTSIWYQTAGVPF